MIYNLENNPTMVVTSSTNENLPRKFDKGGSKRFSVWSLSDAML